ncbi:enoyl-CoA hydratase [Paludibaculum fermentans]|uniref:Enoyl-CoA hydratase domain-containing protein 3, mitochondrial n=1 Tax=Paludibaculum fermentans TaxID=1473598 RepID=A0A7S7NLS5_PALFE|nr:enoyl-CoA hydratase [Paludibaculum fermentans]QOY85924.1 enoyl-CoA hydratase [Paludibaculum fermentans]
MNQEMIHTQQVGAVLTITLARSERRNALSLQMMRELIACLETTAATKEVQVVILAAEGKVFSSGHDLSEMTGRSEAEYREIFETCSAMMETLQRLPQPVIAQVQGLATAAGCQLVAACDLAVASDLAAFATPGVKIGLFCTTPMVPLTRAIGRKRALEMLLTGRLVSANEAAEWGLVNRVVPAAQLNEATQELAVQIAAASSYTVGLGKNAFYRQIDLDQHHAYEYASGVMTENALAGDAQEGISAFLQKRPPKWTGR